MHFFQVLVDCFGRVVLFIKKLGNSQAVRQRVLVPRRGGSNPSSPTNLHFTINKHPLEGCFCFIKQTFSLQTQVLTYEIDDACFFRHFGTLEKFQNARRNIQKLACGLIKAIVALGVFFKLNIDLKSNPDQLLDIANGTIPIQ